MLALAALVAALNSPAGPAADTFAIVPRRHVLDLTVDPRAERWRGSVRSWLTVRRPARRFVLRLAGPVVSRVEMNQLRGDVPVTYAVVDGDSLVVEADRVLVPGPAGLNVGFVGGFADSGAGMARTGPGVVRLARAAGTALPAWPPGAPQGAWSADVHVPAGCTVHANLPRTETSRQGAWRTWSFASSGPTRADSLWIEVRAAARRAPPAR